MAWLSFTLIYCLYWTLEKVEVGNPTDETFLSFLKGLGLVSVLIIVVGIGGEALFVVIDFLIWIGQKVIRKCKKCIGNQIVP